MVYNRQKRVSNSQLKAKCESQITSSIVYRKFSSSTRGEQRKQAPNPGFSCQSNFIIIRATKADLCVKVRNLAGKTYDWDRWNVGILVDIPKDP